MNLSSDDKFYNENFHTIKFDEFKIVSAQLRLDHFVLLNIKSFNL